MRPASSLRRTCGGPRSSTSASRLSSQLERNRESTDRQYALAERAVALAGLATLCGSSTPTLAQRGQRHRPVRVRRADRGGRAGRVGLVLASEVSWLACNNSDWYRLLDLAGMTNTLIGDADGLYHPGMFNDRMLLGLKGTMSEAELHVLRGPPRRRDPQQGCPRRTAARCRSV